MGRHDEKGFTLLEAIVALVLIGTVGAALFGWINRSLDSLARVQSANERNTAVRNALEWMDTVNPMQSPRGEADLGSVTVTWSASDIVPRKDGMDRDGGRSLYQLALYSTQVTVRRGNQVLANFRMRQVGYQQVRELDFEF